MPLLTWKNRMPTKLNLARVAVSRGAACGRARPGEGPSYGRSRERAGSGSGLARERAREWLHAEEHGGDELERGADEGPP